MFFKKRRPNDQKRARKPASTDNGLGSQPVFSYHARSARTEPGGTRRASKSLWTAPDKPSASRRQPRSWLKRVLVLAGTIAVLAFAINSLLLSTNPAVVAVADTKGRQLLLRDQQIYQEAARKALRGSWANTNKVTADTAKITQDIKKQFPELEKVSVTLPIVGRQPVVYLQPAEPALLLKSANSIFVLSESGRAVLDVRQVRQAEKLGLPLVQDQSGLPITLGSAALPGDDVTFITEVAGQLKAKKIKITEIVLPRGTSELNIRIEGAPYFVKFNLRGDARAEAGAFLAVKQHLERENTTPSVYIDVRVENKAYYR
jgi:hypothetical protein